jgi:hypothetical protein
MVNKDSQNIGFKRNQTFYPCEKNKYFEKNRNYDNKLCNKVI